MLICITNRRLCQGDFLQRIREIAEGKPDAIILREKDLPPAAYLELFGQCEAICMPFQVPLIASQSFEAAQSSRARAIQLSYAALREGNVRTQGLNVGVSIHSPAEAASLHEACVRWLIAGHIYPTACKPGVAPRGLDFLRQVCRSTELPVYAIGGINLERAGDVLACGCHGVCVMSELMVCENPRARVEAYQEL